MTRWEYETTTSEGALNNWGKAGWRVAAAYATTPATPFPEERITFLLEREVPQDTPQVQGQLEGPVDVPTPTPSRLEVSQDAVLAVLRDHWPAIGSVCRCGEAFTYLSHLRVHVAEQVAAALTRPHDQTRP